jgi:hypothetical protein
VEHRRFEMVRHVLKGGEILMDISGHLVKVSDVSWVYSLMETMTKKGAKRNDEKLHSAEYHVQCHHHSDPDR